MEKPDWVNHDFTPYDVVIHVAAIVHKKIRKSWQTYYRVSRCCLTGLQKKRKQSRAVYIL